jgi:hypothetical protein
MWVSVPENIGRYGYTVLALNTTITGAFWAIQTLARTVFQSLTDVEGTSWTNVSIAAGVIIYGHFTWASMSSQGNAIMYNCGD